MNEPTTVDEPVWVAVWMSYHQERTDEADSLESALGVLWGVLDSGTGAPKKVIRPDGSVLEGDQLSVLINERYGEARRP